MDTATGGLGVTGSIGGSVPPEPEGPGPIPGAAALPAEEAAVTALVRLLNRVKGTERLSGVDRALVRGAQTMFEELAQVCAALLEARGSSGRPEPAAAAPAPADSPSAPPGSSALPGVAAPSEPSPRASAGAQRRASRVRPTPGGAAQ